MQIQLRGKRVGVEKLKKQDSKNELFLKMPDHEEYLGVVKYVGPDAQSDIKVGQKVYFGNTFQTLRMAGAEICVMEDTNVLASRDE